MPPISAAERVLRFSWIAARAACFIGSQPSERSVCRPADFCFCRTTSPGSTRSSFCSPARGRFVSSSIRSITRTVSSIRSCAPLVASRSRRAERKRRCVCAAEKIRDGEIVCLFPEGATDALRDPPAVATRLRNHRAAGEGTGRAGLARSTLGLDFFLSRAAFFHQMAAAFSVSRDGGIWGAACA